MRHRRVSAGFTLIELMIVVAIIAILSAIAIPQYQAYTIRVQASEGFTIASGAKTAIWEFMTNRGDFPKSNESAGLPRSSSMAGKYVSGLLVSSGGLVTVSYTNSETNDKLKNKNLLLSPVANGGSISWACKGTIDAQYLPTACRKT
ncbi:MULTISPECIES: pilin [Luteibacter]|uniref:pilin n=1 Tax=Luteibacter TaxID=242605 RepID=UPI00055AEB58|nr:MULTISPECIES: pilin [unclassified Luteibacter]